MKSESLQSHYDLVIEKHVNAARCLIVVSIPNRSRSRMRLPRSPFDRRCADQLKLKRIQTAMMQGGTGAAIQGCGVRRSLREVAWVPASVPASGRAAGHGAAAKAGL